MFYLIGLGLNVKGISIEGLEAVKKCQKVYLESYTVDFPYSVEDLEKELKAGVIKLSREQVESERFLNDAKQEDIAMLVYGSPLAATTHISLLLKCKKENISYKIIHSASVVDAIAETGLQLYKFGRTASMPKWQRNYKPESFVSIIKENIKIKAHTLLLVDIGMPFSESLKQLIEAAERNQKNNVPPHLKRCGLQGHLFLGCSEIKSSKLRPPSKECGFNFGHKENKMSLKLDKVVVCSRMGTKEQDILYNDISKLKKKKVKSPFCIIIPGELHFIEEEALRRFKN
ncbi:diphthine synthase [Candidatus Pacearchaeota archaeon]|nr:diphthine synthase [Candidatus Pacearchaeota archaeon]